MQLKPANRSNSDASGFVEGVDSFSHPLSIKPSQVRWLINAVTKGGILQTRPGYKTRAVFSGSVNGAILHPQMLAKFEPTSSPGLTQLVFAVSGTVWFCNCNADGSLQVPQQMTNVAMNPNADQLFWANCVQSTDLIGGAPMTNVPQRNVLVIQDGANRAVVWDGIFAQTMNPRKSLSTTTTGDTYYTDGWNETRIGSWMAWSGNRLWIASGSAVYASDLGDPTHFTEELAYTSFQAFYFGRNVTGMADRGTSGATNSQVVIFTAEDVWTIWSGVALRSSWSQTPNFVTKIFDRVGCTAGKSIVVHLGIIYWQSETGIVLFDSTGTVFSTQNIPQVDNELAYSKSRMGGNRALTCAGYRDSYVFWSVPVGPVTNGRAYNGHTQVLDRNTLTIHTVGITGPFSYGTTGWQGVWTGIRPVEWATAQVNGVFRPYALSMDLDGVVRIWEAFQGNRADNGQEIPWTIETRSHLPENRTLFDLSQFNYMQLFLQQIKGNLSVIGSYRGFQGNYHQHLSTSVTATPGPYFSPVPGDPQVVANPSRPNADWICQSRTIKSTSRIGEEDSCTSADVESPHVDAIDRGFSLLLNLTGRGAVVAYRIATDDIQDSTEGEVMTPETGFNELPVGQCPLHVAGGAAAAYVLPDEAPWYSLVPLLPAFVETDSYQSPPPVT